MRVVRFVLGETPSYGLVEGDEIVPLRAAPWETGGEAVPFGERVPRREARLLVPTTPSKILAIGRNYRAHAAEMGHEVPAEPLVFLKVPSSLLAHKGTVLLPKGAGRVDFEGELALVIGRRARRVLPGAWRDVVFGLTVAIDISAREYQKKDGQWWRAKGFDTFCPLGPAVVTDADPGDLLLTTTVDGTVKQSARTSAMIFDVGTLVAFISEAVTLEPGDVILTGTPEGVAPLAPGQTLEVAVERVGALTVRIEAEG